MILGAKEIYRLIKENKLAVHPLFDDAIRENGVDLVANTPYIHTAEL
jgi:deoxycytidine triphosphate deaminase